MASLRSDDRDVDINPVLGRVRKELWRHTVVSRVLGATAELLFWIPVLAAGCVAFLGAVGSERLGLPRGYLEPWIAGISAASASIAVVGRQARLQQKATAFFDFVAFTKNIIMKAETGLLSARDFVETYTSERMKLQTRLKAEDSARDLTTQRQEPRV